ncbi:hypothetical protein ACG1BZ_06250 [Microbulbifer sp. CNSA002]|uniref:hypothetical protein n=1 Tax=Microbulbifer sp. CNSA002 TaxID=3373604 RepID=UPI0039B5D431
MKNLIIILLSMLLLASLAGAVFVTQDLMFAKPKHPNIHWSEEDRITLNKAYLELAKSNQIPIYSHPYEIVRSEKGTSVRFRTNEYLRLRKSFLIDGEIYDGCMYAHFNQDIKLQEVFYCG